MLLSTLLTAQVDVNGSWLHLTVADGLPGAEVRAVLPASSGTTWFAVRGHGLAGRHRDGSWEYITVADGLASNGVAQLQEIDRMVWAVGQGGYAIRRGGTWNPHRTVGDRDARVVFSVTETAEGVWLGATGFGARWNGASWEFHDVSTGLPHAVVHQVLTDGRGITWFACRRGLGRRETGTTVALFPEVNFRAIVEDAAGRVWFGTGGDGVWVYADGAWRRDLPGQTVLPRFVDRDGTVWATTEGSGLYQFIDGAWRVYTTADGLLSDVVYDVQGADGALWIATDRGVSRWLRR